MVERERETSGVDWEESGESDAAIEPVRELCNGEDDCSFRNFKQIKGFKDNLSKLLL